MPEISNPQVFSIIDAIAPLYGVTGMYGYPILLRLRPPRVDLFNRIMAAEGAERFRMMYSYVIDYVRGGADTIFKRQGLMMNLPGDNFAIVPVPASIPISDVHDVTPVPYSESFMSDFRAANPTYMAFIDEYDTGYVIAAYTDEVNAIIYPIAM